MRTVAARGRWVWGISGVVTAALIAAPGVHLITSAGTSAGPEQPLGGGTVTRTMTVPQPVTSLTVQSYGASVQVTGGPVSQVQVSETMGTSPGGGTPSVAASVSGDHLTVGSPACQSSQDCASFAVTVPRDVTVAVASESGPVTVSGVAGVNLDSGGGSITVSRIDGPVTATSDGGPVQLAGVTGAAVRVDTGGGAVTASGLVVGAATFSADGGPVQVNGRVDSLQAYSDGGSATITLSAPPAAVTINSDGGPATLRVPGGPYALLADSDGGPEMVYIATSPSAQRSITVTSGGGSLQISP
jgi:hypothetical protein